MLEVRRHVLGEEQPDTEDAPFAGVAIAFAQDDTDYVKTLMSRWPALVERLRTMLAAESQSTEPGQA